MPTKANAGKGRPQVPASAPVRVEIRVNGRVLFSNVCYSPDMRMDEENGRVGFAASLNPTMVDAPLPPPQVPFSVDPRNGEDIIQQVHSGRRDITKSRVAVGPTRGAETV
jgi:hypothetical protein